MDYENPPLEPRDEPDFKEIEITGWCEKCDEDEEYERISFTAVPEYYYREEREPIYVFQRDDLEHQKCIICGEPLTYDQDVE